MKTDSRSINYVLTKNATSFFIPPFQRAYAWGKPEIERYFNDISKIIESELDDKQHDKLEHFFGTLVIKEQKAGLANKSIVIDGQQRLTTTLIFLIALRDSETDQSNIDKINKNYLTNDNSDFEDKIKLKPVTKDWDSYKALVKGEKPNPGFINDAYNILKEQINKNKEENPKVAFEQYIKAIERMNVAVIFLNEKPHKGEDPQVIFETLNSLGKPLTLSDLVRNFVLLNMKSDDQSNRYEKIWHPKIEDILDENTSKFFRDYLQYKTASSLKVVNDSNTKELYQRFKDFVDKKFDSYDDFIKDIVRFVEFYKWIITEVVNDTISSNHSNDKIIKELLRNIFHDIKTQAFKPFVLGLLEYHKYRVNNVKLSDQTLITTLQRIRTYLIRRRILKLTKGENKHIPTLSKEIESISKGTTSMLELLTNMPYNLRLPLDSEMKNTLTTMNFYEDLKQYSKLVLGKIEEENAKVAVNFRDKKITIEHIMPQKLEDSWKRELGEHFSEIHETYLHNIGNLILTEFNIEIGNKPFEEKKKKLATSSLKYRLDIINKNIWNEDSIKDHQLNMIKRFLSTFPLPKKIQKNKNTFFSPLDSNAGEMAEGNRPVELLIDQDAIKVKTWQDVLIEFFKYLKDNSAYDLESILDKTELFKKDKIIIRPRLLKKLIDDKPSLKKEFKSLSGNSWNDEKELNDDSLFVNINISASRCMVKIGNVMQKFNMAENAVQIKLK